MASRFRHDTIENLEPRRLFDATAELTDGELTVTGTEGKDAIVISLDRDDPALLDVRIGKETFEFDAGDVDRITVDALGGNDKVTLKEKNGAIYADTHVIGGDGNDTVTTGSGNDVIDAGDGNDKVTGGAGDDLLSGAAGNDRLAGGDDNDQLDAGDGKDKLDGAAGDDNLDGGTGKDAVKAGDGADRVAVDDANAAEVRGSGSEDVTNYTVTDVATLPQALTTLLAEVGTFIPSFQVVRAEAEGENYSVYYHFGTDPGMHKVVLSVVGDEVELVTRQVSLQESRDVAFAAFVQDHPDAVNLVSIFQYPGSRYEIRYRTADGTVVATETHDILWGIDDLESDLDNDGRSDNYHPDGGDNNGGDNNGGNGN